MKSDNQTPLILLVDDEQHLCWVLQKVLSEAGYRTRIARNGKEALQACIEDHVTLTIIDYRLPDTNGIDLFQQLNQIGQQKTGILITSYGSLQLREQALAAGFLFYFDKPLSHKHLLECLTKVTTDAIATHGAGSPRSPGPKPHP